MENVIRLTGVTIKNVKNVKNGTLHMNTQFESTFEPDVVGVYGQNGSGKTALVEAFDLLKKLIHGERESLPSVDACLIYYGEKTMELDFQFNVINHLGMYFVSYRVVIGNGENSLVVLEEELKYKENQPGKRFKSIVSKKMDELVIRNISMDKYDESQRVNVLVANKLAMKNGTSFIFREELFEVYKSVLNEIEYALILNMEIDFRRDFHVIKGLNYGYMMADLLMPFSIHLDGARGEIPYKMQGTTDLPIKAFKDLIKVIDRTNVALRHIIPDLQIHVNKITELKLDDGKEGIRFEFLSKRGNIELPLRTESQGTLKIISILSTLIAVYNNVNAFVVIDELDASVFEFLLGEILEIMHESGEGQLLFTSHNLRILEVLPKENLWFTTTNEENRFIQLKGIKKDNNIRDVYLRAVQLGGQNEDIYAETDAFEMKMALREAGNIYEED